MKNALHGFKPDHLEYLCMSYLMGPNEGWIALKRNVLALAVDVAEMAICELTNLLSSGFVRGQWGSSPGLRGEFRDLLLPHLKNVAVSRREDFARVLYLGGYDVEVPDIMRSDPRP